MITEADVLAMVERIEEDLRWFALCRPDIEGGYSEEPYVSYFFENASGMVVWAVRLFTLTAPLPLDPKLRSRIRELLERLHEVSDWLIKHKPSPYRA